MISILFFSKYASGVCGSAAREQAAAAVRGKRGGGGLPS